MGKLITLRIVKRTYQMAQRSEYLVSGHEISSGGAVVQVSGDARVSVAFRYRQEVLSEHPRIAPDVGGRFTSPTPWRCDVRVAANEQSAGWLASSEQCGIGVAGDLAG